MAFQPIDFSRAQSTADWSGLRDAVQQYYASQKGAIESRLLPPKLMAEAEMYRQHGNLYGAQIPEASAKGHIAQLKAAIISQLLSGTGDMSGDMNGFIGTPGSFNMQQGAGQPGGFSGNNALAQALAGEALGLTPQSYLTQSGELVSQYLPGAEAFKQKVGPSFEEVAYGTEMGKQAADYRIQNSAKYEGALGQRQTLEGLDSLINRPEFRDAVGPANQILSKYYAPEDVQEIQAQADILSKGLVVDMMKNAFGSRVTDRDLKFVQSQKPNVADPLPVFAAKVKTLLTLSDAAVKKHGLIEEYLDNGYSRKDANTMADEQVNIRQVMNDLYKENVAKKEDQIKVELKSLGFSDEDLAKIQEKTGSTYQQILDFAKKRKKK